MTELPERRRVRWSKAYRIIPSRYPPIQLFERIGDPEDWEALAAIEGLTNDRIREEIGDISVVPPEERVSGPGASWVMAPFTHLGRPSRFSDGSFGVYYCARPRATAVAETVHHMGRFYAATAEAPLDVDTRVLVGRVDATFHDLRPDPAHWRAVLDPDDYTASQALGARLRREHGNGIACPSVRHEGGECLGALRPRALHVPVQGPHLTYHWDGERIDRFFDHRTESWAGT